ncbi:MAG TPA: DUF397 domain-containing protein [Streptosporangiaceae bacterium]|jgi:hypothetical protein|nr:DUF397 domain-containing protein [Streptosporangiaceae bacterium]
MSTKNLEISGLQWRKARRSANNGACVELAPAGGQILIRDSKDQNGPVIDFSEYSWRLFLAAAKTGHFDPERV